jgi:hypothetical protein
MVLARYESTPSVSVDALAYSKEEDVKLTTER